MKQNVTCRIVLAAAAFGFLGIGPPASGGPNTNNWTITIVNTTGQMPDDIEFTVGPTGSKGITTFSPLSVTPAGATSIGATNSGGPNGTNENTITSDFTNPLNPGGTYSITVTDNSVIAPQLISGNWTFDHGAGTRIPIGGGSYSVPEGPTFAFAGVGVLGMLGSTWRQRKRTRRCASA
jgi:hypothetical protein